MNMARAVEKYKVVCPVCGKQLFSSSSADIEDVMCPKCQETVCCQSRSGQPADQRISDAVLDR